MAAPSAEELAAVEARLIGLLAPYERELEWATIYGNRTLRRPGTKAHDWFAFVKPATKHVSLFLLPVHVHPSLREGLSPALGFRLTGKATFNFTGLDDALAVEIGALLARAFEAYMGRDAAA